jgi:hypothetical protein
MHQGSFLLSAVVALELLACAGQNGSGDEGNGASAAAPGIGSVPVGQGGTGTAGSTGSMTAEQTQDGLLPITSAQANAILDDPVKACTGWSEEPESAASVLEFIVDVSGSMNSSTATTGGLSKWVVTQRSLHAAIGVLPTALPVGLTFFPNMQLSAAYTSRPVTACVNSKNDIPIAPLSDAQRTTLTTAVDNMGANKNGATPTHDAYNIALGNMRNNTSPGQKYLVLITDGQPTQSLGCIGSGMTSSPEPTQPVVDAVAAAWNNDKIKTFIVGSPGSEENVSTHTDSRDWLSAAARAGGTDTAGCNDHGPLYCHFDLSTATDFGQALSDALGKIAKTVVSCDYSVPSAGAGKTIDTNLVNMIYDDGAGNYSLVLPSGESACQKGWTFTDTTLTRLHVCDQTCALLQSNPHATISLVFGCTQEQIQTPIL